MSSLLDVLKKVVTPENVNCIPDDFSASLFSNFLTPHKINYNLCKLIRFCKEQNYGFIQLAILNFDTGSVEYLLSNFKSFIRFELITLPDNPPGLDIFNLKEFKKTLLLEWCAEYCNISLVMLLGSGVRVGGIEEAFQILANRKIYTRLTEIALEKMLQMGVGFNDTSPQCYWRVTELIEKYRGRDRCKKAVVYLLGLIKFKKTRYFSGLDPRLLKQMVVTSVWETRYSECWDTTEVKKLKI